MKCWTWLFLTIPFALGASMHSQGQRAQAFLEAGQPNEACAIYRKVLEAKLAPWERRYVEYNLGTAELALGQLRDARKHFEQLVAQAQGDPVLLRCAHTNFAHTCLQLSQQLQEELGDEPHRVRMQCQQALELLQAGAQACALANEQASELDGDEKEPSDLRALRRLIKKSAGQWLELRQAMQQETELHAALLVLADQVGCSSRRIEHAVVSRTPILPQLARLSERFWPCWESACAQAIDYEVPCSRLRNAWSCFQCSQEYLQEGMGYHALEQHIASQVGVQAAAHAASSEPQSLEPLLKNRCDIARRWERARGERPYAECLARVEGRYRETARSLLREEKGSDPLSDLILERLALRMGREPTEAAEAVLRSNDDLWLYRQVAQPEESDMAYLCAELKRGQWPEQLVSRIGALREKVSARLELCDEPRLAQRLHSVHEPLDEAMELIAQAGGADTHQLLHLVEAALRAWSPSAWLHSYLADWQDRCGWVLDKETVTGAFLEELSQEQSQVLNTLEKEGIDPSPHVQRACRDVELAHQQTTEQRAMLCIQDAHRALGWAIEELEPKELPQPGPVLEQTIREQEFARKMQDDAQKAARGNLLEQELLELLCSAQDRVLKRAKPFPAALDMTEDKENAHILRLYQEGLEEAKGYDRHLRSQQPEWAEADLRQELALEKWKEALRLLQDPEQGQGDEPTDESEGGETKERPSSIAQAPKELFELLQRMDDEDRPAPSSEPPLRRGIRPW